MEIVGRGKEQGLHIRARTVLAKEVMGEDLGPAGMKIRMVMGYDEHACSQESYSGFEAMTTS